MKSIFLSLLGSALTSLSVGHCLRDSHQGLLCSCNLLEESEFSVLSLEDLLAGHLKLQKRLTTAISESIASSMQTLSNDDHCSACLRSIEGKEVGAWIHAVPSVNELTLGVHEFCLAVCVRLGLYPSLMIGLHPVSVDQ